MGIERRSFIAALLALPFVKWDIPRRIPYTNCKDDVPACDVCWTFKPLYIPIDNRESCLVGAGLKLSGEWCSEPVVACNVVVDDTGTVVRS